MKKSTAKEFDQLLLMMCGRNFVHVDEFPKISEDYGVSIAVIKDAMSVFTADDFVKPLTGVETGGIYGYEINDKGRKFVLHQGGYSKKFWYDIILSQNIVLIWLRHWIWFAVSLVSVPVNFYYFFFHSCA